MRDALLKWLLLAKLSIHMMRVEITRLASVQDDIGFRDGASMTVVSLANLVVLEVLHYSPALSTNSSR
jgi:hypothetical protein